MTVPGRLGHFGKIQVGAATRSLSCFVLVPADDLSQRHLRYALIYRTVHHHHADVVAIEGDSYRRREAATDKKA